MDIIPCGHIPPNPGELLAQKKFKILRSFYIIGYVSSDRSTQRHELSHAFFNLYPEYASLIESMYDQISDKTKAKLNGCLQRRGYAEELYVDEFGAYLLEGDKEVCKYVHDQGWLTQVTNLFDQFSSTDIVQVPVQIQQSQHRNNPGDSCNQHSRVFRELVTTKSAPRLAPLLPQLP